MSGCEHRWRQTTTLQVLPNRETRICRLLPLLWEGRECPQGWSPQRSVLQGPYSNAGLPRRLSGKEPPARAGATGDVSSVPGWGRCPGAGNGNPLQSSCLGDPMYRGAWWAAVHAVTEWDTTEQPTHTAMLSAPAGPCSQIWPLSQLPLHPSSWRSWYRSFNTAPGPQTWGETGSHHCTATKVRLAPILHLNLKLSPPAITSRVLFLGHIFCTCDPLGQVKVTQSCLTLWNPKDYTVHGILQARILAWVAIPFSRGSSQPRDRTQVSCIAGGFFTSWATREEALVASPLPFLIGDLLPDLRSQGLPRCERTDFSGHLHVPPWVSNNVPNTSKTEFFSFIALLNFDMP